MDFLLRLPRLATTRRGNFVSGRDRLIYIKGAIAPRGLIQLYGARYVFYNCIGYVAGLVHTGHDADESFAAIGSLVVLAGMLMFGWQVYRCERGIAGERNAIAPAE